MPNPPDARVAAKIVHHPKMSFQRMVDLKTRDTDARLLDPRIRDMPETPFEERTYPAWALCGNCDQRLMAVGNVIGMSTWGWRLDGDTWRPTSHHRNQRTRAKRLLSERRLSDRLSVAERERLRHAVRSGNFSRGQRIDGGLHVNNQFILGCNIECPECGAVNQVPTDL